MSADVTSDVTNMGSVANDYHVSESLVSCYGGAESYSPETPLLQSNTPENTSFLESHDSAVTTNPFLSSVVDFTVTPPVAASEFSDSGSYCSDTPLIDPNASTENIVCADNLAMTNPVVAFSETQSLADNTYCNNATYDSETPLIGTNVADNTSMLQEEQEFLSHKVLDTIAEGALTELQIVDVTVLDDLKSNKYDSVIDVSQFQSGLSINFSEQPTATPIRIIGSGWEFGSICSINLHADTSPTVIENAREGRLLSRIFSKTVNYLEIRSQKEPLKQDIATVEVCKDPLEAVKVLPDGRNVRNLLILSFSMTLLHIAVYGLRNLQSSLNTEAGLGVFSLAAIFAAFMIGSLISPFIVKRFPSKKCLCLSTAGHLPYLISNYHPTFYSLILASCLMGFSNAVLWNALCTYITEIGIHESFKKNKLVGNVLSRFFGIFFLILQLSVVFGNLISSIVLSSAYKRLSGLSNLDLDLNKTDVMENVTIGNLTNLPHCGVDQCHDEADSGSSPVDDIDKLFLIGTYVSCTIIAVIVLYCLLDRLPTFTPQPIRARELVRGVCDIVAMVIDRKFMFIVLLCMYTVFSNGFVVADVLKAFITCPLGVQMVGYSMICFGICGSVSSYVFGKLTKYFGRISVFLSAAALNLMSLGLMTFWDMTSPNKWFLIGLLGLWGFADGIWQSQINSLISTVFADRYETAFSCCRVLQGLAGIIIFLMSNVICMFHKIIFIAATCVLSVILYIVMEIIVKKEQPKVVAEVEVECDA